MGKKKPNKEDIPHEPEIRRLSIDLGNVFQQVNNSGGVTIFVIVPGDQLNKGRG